MKRETSATLFRMSRANVAKKIVGGDTFTWEKRDRYAPSRTYLQRSISRMPIFLTIQENLMILSVDKNKY